jgi:hypothetical protein
MKTIREAAKEYAELHTRGNDEMARAFKGATSSAFMEGAQFAQRWISVEEELPSPNSEFIHTSLFVLVKTDIGFIRTATYNHQKRCFVTERGMQLDKDLGNVTHWRHIELK